MYGTRGGANGSFRACVVIELPTSFSAHVEEVVHFPDERVQAGKHNREPDRDPSEDARLLRDYLPSRRGGARQGKRGGGVGRARPIARLCRLKSGRLSPAFKHGVGLTGIPQVGGGLSNMPQQQRTVSKGNEESDRCTPPHLLRPSRGNTGERHLPQRYY